MEIINLLSQVIEVTGRIHQIEVKDWMHVYSLRWAIYEALQTLLDACSMIIAELELRKPSSYSEIADILAEAKLLNGNEASRLKSIVKIRNRVAHTYRRLDLDELKQYGNEAIYSRDLALKLMDGVRVRNIDPPRILDALTPIFRKWSILLVYLFGSRARKLESRESDWDIAILPSGELETKDLDRLQIEIAEILKVNEDKIDITLLNKADLHLKFRIVKEGIAIYQAKPELKTKFEAETLIEYLDARGIYEIYLKRILKRGIK